MRIPGNGLIHDKGLTFLKFNKEGCDMTQLKKEARQLRVKYRTLGEDIYFPLAGIGAMLLRAKFRSKQLTLNI